MDCHIELPPSPPASTSNKSSPTTLPTSPILTPPPDLFRAPSLSPTPGTSPLSPLPAELFLLAMQYIPPPEIPRLCLVSRAWASFLAAEPHLWPQPAIYLERDQQRVIEQWTRRSTVNHRRTSGGAGIKDVVIYLGARSGPRGQFMDIVDTETMKDRLDYLISALNYACVPVEQRDHFGQPMPRKPSTLKSMRILLQPNSVVSVWVIYLLVQYSTNPLFEQLARLELRCQVPDLKILRCPFLIWPSLIYFHLENQTEDQEGIEIVNTDWQLMAPPRCAVEQIPLQTANLYNLAWTGVIIRRPIHFPQMPNLASIYLNNVSWEGLSLFYLLRSVRHSLVSLRVHDLRLEDVDGYDDYDDWIDNVHVRDPCLTDGHIFPDVEPFADGEDADELEAGQPAPIIFPRLQTLVLSGETTPALFASIDSFDVEADGGRSHPTPIFVMPALKSATIEDVLTDDPTLEDAYGALTVLGRNATNLHELSLVETCVGDATLFQCLASMTGCLRRLTLFDSNVTDRVLVSLPKLIPQLEYLDVRGSTEITIQGVAHAVEVMRDQSEGRHRLSTVFVDPPESVHREYHSSRESAAWRWLDWVSVLGRDEWDFEGAGPVSNPVAWRGWKRKGKEDALKDLKIKLREKEEMVRQNAILQAHQAAAFRPQIIGGSASYPSVLVPNQQLRAFPQYQQQGSPFLHQRPAAMPQQPIQGQGHDSEQMRHALAYALGSNNYPIGPPQPQKLQHPASIPSFLGPHLHAQMAQRAPGLPPVAAPIPQPVRDPRLAHLDTLRNIDADR